VCTYVHMYVCIYGTYVCMHIWCICMYAYMVHMYVCIYGASIVLLLRYDSTSNNIIARYITLTITYIRTCIHAYMLLEAAFVSGVRCNYVCVCMYVHMYVCMKLCCILSASCKIFIDLNTHYWCYLTLVYWCCLTLTLFSVLYTAILHLALFMLFDTSLLVLLYTLMLFSVLYTRQWCY
jgi:hypothetical protein